MKRSDNMEQILAYIDAHPDKNITVGELAALLDYSFYHFCHAFSSYTGVPVAAYLRRRRMAAAARDLLSGKSSVSVAAARGFQTLSGFAKAFRKHYGLSPSEYQKELADERFRIEPEFRSLASFTAVGYRLSPPQGESDVLNAGAYWMGRELPLSARRITGGLADRNPQRSVRGFSRTVTQANYFISSGRSCRVPILSRTAWSRWRWSLRTMPCFLSRPVTAI